MSRMGSRDSPARQGGRGMAKGQHTQPDRTDASAPHEARRNLPGERAHESATAAPPWLMPEKVVVPERVAGYFNRSALTQRIRPSDRQGTLLKARRVGDVRAPGFRSTVLDTSTPRRTLLRSRPALLCMHNKARPGEPRRGNQRDSRPPTQVVDLARARAARTGLRGRQIRRPAPGWPGARRCATRPFPTPSVRRSCTARTSGPPEFRRWRTPYSGKPWSTPAFSGTSRPWQTKSGAIAAPCPAPCATPPCSSARTGSPTSYGR